MQSISRSDAKWLLYHHKNRGLKFDNGNTVTGTESENHKGSKPPTGSISDTSVSTHTKRTQSALRGDREDMKWVMDELTKFVVGKSTSDKWRVESNARQLAFLGLYPLIWGIPLTDKIAGASMGKSRQSYNEVWKSRVSEITLIAKSWRNG